MPPPAWRRQVAGPAAATLWSVAAGRWFELTQHGPSCAQGGGSELGAFLQWVTGDVRMAAPIGYQLGPYTISTWWKLQNIIYIYWTVPPYTNSHHNPDHKKKHKHDGPKMPLRSWVGTFCQPTNPQRSWGFHSMNQIVHKEVGFVYTLTGKGQWELRSVYWKIQGNPVQRLRLCTILSNQRRPTK